MLEILLGNYFIVVWYVFKDVLVGCFLDYEK